MRSEPRSEYHKPRGGRPAVAGQLRFRTKDGVVRKSDAVESLQHRLRGLLIEVFSLELDLDVTVERRRHARIRECCLVHRQTVLAPGGPHVDQNGLSLARSDIEALSERSVPTGFHLLVDARPHR